MPLFSQSPLASAALPFGPGDPASTAMILLGVILGILAIAGVALVTFLKKKPSIIYKSLEHDTGFEIPPELQAQLPAQPDAPTDALDRHRRMAAIENAGRDLACRVAREVGVLDLNAESGPGKVWVLAGPGPQGATAMAAARHLDSLGVTATTQLMCFSDKLGEEAAAHRKVLTAARLRLVDSPTPRPLTGFARLIVGADAEYLSDARRKDLQRIITGAHDAGVAVEDVDEFSAHYASPPPSDEDVVIPAIADALSSEEVRLLDSLAMQNYGLPGAALMENAGYWAAREACFILRALESERKTPAPVVVVCGKGNNGGDGYVIARHLLQWGHPAEVFLLGLKDHVSDDAGQNLRLLEEAGTKVWPLFDDTQWPRLDAGLQGAALIVDAVLGTGMQGAVRGPALVAIEKINVAHERGAKVLAVDCPSGIDCNTGAALGACVRADVTVTFAAAKRGFELGQGPEWCGSVIVADIGLPREMYRKRQTV